MGALEAMDHDNPPVGQRYQTLTEQLQMVERLARMMRGLLEERLIDYRHFPDAEPSSAEWMAREAAASASNYDHALPVVAVQGEGPYVWDAEGRCYIDFITAYSTRPFGFVQETLGAMPDAMHVLAEMTLQALSLGVTSRAYHNDALPAFLEKIAEASGFGATGRVLPANGGAESVETAIQMAYAWGKQVKGVDDPLLIVADGNFHGRTSRIKALSVGEDNAEYHEIGYIQEAMQAHGAHVPFGDAEELQDFLEAPYTDARGMTRKNHERVVAFLVEPIQGEKGIVVPPAGYLLQVAELAKRYRFLAIFDEIQTGLGRTGEMLAIHHEIPPQAERPDLWKHIVVVLGKALGGGLVPSSAVIADAGVMGVVKSGTHGSTFGGNPLAAAAGTATLELLRRGDALENSRELGAYMLERLRAMQERYPFIKEVRGKGLFIGVEIDPAQASAEEVNRQLLENRLLSKVTHGVTLRFAPPLNLTREQADQALEIVDRSLEQVHRRLCEERYGAPGMEAVRGK